MKSRETQLKQNIETLNGLMINASAEQVVKIRQALAKAWVELTSLRQIVKA